MRLLQNKKSTPDKSITQRWSELYTILVQLTKIGDEAAITSKIRSAKTLQEALKMVQ